LQQWDQKIWGENMKQKNIKKSEQIAQDIVELTKSLDSQQELKKTWRVINMAMQYLSSKDDYLTNEKNVLEKVKEMKDAKKEEGN